MAISVMITTRNRSAELAHTLRRLNELNPPPDEILVTADDCEDDTAAMVRREFPSVRRFVNDRWRGSVPSRDRMLREATSDIVLSLDDDSYPLDGNFFARLPAVFDAHPEAAVITFPELRDSNEFESRMRTSGTTGHYASAYPNCAAAMRRQAYFAIGGYPLFFEHAYEETDYALQCYGSGYAVWFEPTLIIRHRLAAKNRSSYWTHQFNARNELWSVWMRCPWPWLPIVTVYRVARQFLYSASNGLGWLVNEPRWWMSALRGMRKCIAHRRPIPWRAYYTWIRMARRPTLELPAVFSAKDLLKSNDRV